MGTIGGNQFQFNEIQNAYELFKSYDKNKGAIKGGKVTDLFFVHTGHGLEFVKKYSVSGQWMRFVSWVKHTFGNEDRTFDVEKNLSEVGKLYEKIFSELSVEDTKQLDGIAKQLGIQPKGHLTAGEVLRENLLELGIHLNQLKYRVERSRFEQKQEAFLSSKKVGKGPEFQPLQGIHIPLYAKRVQSSFATFQTTNQTENRQVFDAIGKRYSKQLSQDEVQAVASCIISSGKKAEILQELESDKNATLLSSLRKTFSFAIAKENRTLIRSALDKIAPLAAPDEASKLDISNFSAFLGRPDENKRPTISIEDNHKLALKFLKSSNAKPELVQLVEETIIISPELTIDELKKRVESKQKCLVLGGTSENPILFSIEKQPDGKYSVKIYSQEPQKALPPELKSTSQKAQGFLEIHDVKRDTFFKEGFLKPSVLTALVKLRTKEESDASFYFEENVIGQLGASKAENEFMQNLLSPKQSGTPASRVIMAALSNEMEQSDALKLQQDFDKYLLDSFAQDLINLVRNPIAKEAYPEMHALYTSIKHTLDEYHVQNASDTLALYDDLLDRFNEKLLGLQKELYTQELLERSPIQGHLAVDAPKGKKPPEETNKVAAAVIHPVVLNETELATFTKVQNLPFEQGLAALVTLSPSAEMYLYIAETLFKKAGGLTALAQLNINNPKKALQDLTTLTAHLATNIDASNASMSQTMRFGLFLAASYVRENAFRRLNDEERVFKNDFPSVLGSFTVYEKMQKCRTSDAYWNNFFKEATQLRETLTTDQKKVADHLFDNSLHKEERVDVSPYVVEEVTRWVRNTAFAMPEKINASIAADRDAQNTRIKNEIAAEEIKLAGYIKTRDSLLVKESTLKSEKARLLAAGKKLDEDSKQLEAKLKELEGKKQTRSVTKAEQELSKAQKANEEAKKKVAENHEKVNKIDEELTTIAKNVKKIEADIDISKKRINSGIEKEVHDDPQYWPWGIGANDPATARWSPEEVASYFLAEHAGFYKTKLQVENVLPDQFRSFRTHRIITRNIFNKVEGSPPTDIPFTWVNHKLKAGLQGACFRESVKRPDIYLNDLKTKQDIYTHLYNNHYIDELSIPHAVHQGLANAIAEKNQAPTKLSQIKGMVSSFFSSKEISLDDEMRELCLLHCAQELQIDTLIGYFQENPKKLFERDARVLFHALAFESDLLLQAFKNEKTGHLVATRFNKLFRDVIESARQLGDAETYASVCWLAASVQGHINQLGLAEKLPTILSATDLMNLARNCYEQSHKSNWGIVAESILAASKHIQTAHVGNKDQQALFVLGLLSRAVRNMSNLPKEKVCELRSQDSQSGELMLKVRLAKTDPKDMQKMLESTAPGILKIPFPLLEHATFKASSKQDEPYVFLTDDQKTILSLTDGLLTSSDPAVFRNPENPLPTEVKNLLIQQKVYEDQEVLADLKCYREGNIVTINDKKNGMSLKVSLKHSDIFIQKTGMPWCHYLHSSSRLSLGGQHTLVSLQQWFDAEKKKTYFVDPRTFEAKFVTDEAGCITNIKNGLQLGNTKPDSFLAGFEESGHTLYWVDKDKKLLSIDFPRLGLSLERQEKGSFALKGASDWIVSKEQFLPHIDQKDGFLVLESAKTKEKKVLLPVWDLTDKGTYDFKTEALAARTLEYTLKDDRLIPRSLEARLYLAELSLTRGDIDQAEKLLFAREAEVTSRKLCSRQDFERVVEEEKLQGQGYKNAYQSDLHEEVERYKSIARADYQNPRAICLQMHALYLLKKNEEQFPKDALKEDPLAEMKMPEVGEIEAELNLVFAYLDTAADLRPIAPHEELLVLKNIMRQIENQRYREEQNPQADKLHYDNLAELQTRLIELEHAVGEKNEDESKVAILSETKVKGEISADTSDEARKNYVAFRLESRLPFNPLNVDEDEFKKYLPLIQEEASKLSSREAVQKSGLLSPLSNLSQFGKSPFIKQSAASILSMLEQKEVLSAREIHQNLQPLSLLKTMGEDRGVTRKLCQEYFERGPKKAASPIPSDILSPYCPEIAKGDVITSKKFKDQAQDIQVATSTLAPGNYTLKNGKELIALKATLEEQRSQELKLLAEEESLIINTVAQALQSDPLLAHEFALKRKFYPTIEEITLLAARKNFDAFAAKFYPQISPEGRATLKEAVKKYLFQKETVQQLTRSLEAVNDLLVAMKEEKSDLIESLQNNLATQLELTRAYPPDHKHVMIFLFIETVLNIKLRPDQVQNILKFDKAILDDKSLVMQMIMGSGKTEVIQPFLAILLAKPNTLSTVIVPESLFQEVRKILTLTLGSAADQLLYTMPYDKELSQDPTFLDTFLQRLQEAKERGGTVLFTPRQKHSILTSLYEAYFEQANSREMVVALKKQKEEKQEKIAKEQLESSPDKNFIKALTDRIAEIDNKIARLDEAKLEARIDKISAIADFLQLHEIDQIDEIDIVMNPQVVFKRPIGEAIIFDEAGKFERAKLLAELTIRLAKNDKLRKEVSIDFVNAMQTAPGKEIEKSGLEINEQLYLAKVQPYLVREALDILQNKNEQLRTLISEDKTAIEHFICQTASEKEREWIKTKVTNQQAQDLLSSATNAISKIFPASLLNECKSNYGKDPSLEKANLADRKYIARPYFAPDAPKPTVYADPHEKIIYSVQYYIFNGIPLQDAKEMLIEWQQLARKEMKAGRKLEDTTWNTRFYELIEAHKQPSGLNFLEDPKSENFKDVVDAFQKAISKDAQTLLEFCEKRVFPQNTLYRENATSTPQTLAGSSKTVFGYTGTIHQAILGAFMSAIPQIGTDGKTIAAIERKILRGTARVDSLPKSAKLADEVIAQFKDPDYYFFIDSGNWLKDVEIKSFADRILKECGRKDIEGVVYLDKNGNKMSYELNDKGIYEPVPFESSRLKNSPEKRLVVISRKYETGTNISPQLSTAKGFLSIRKGMTLRDSLQAAFRMRKILEGQAITIKVADEVKSHISQGLLEGILSHDEIREFIEKKQPIDIAAFREKLDNLKVQSALDGEALQDATKQGYLSIHPELKDQLIKAAQKYNEKAEFTLLAMQEAFSQSFVPDSKSVWRYFTANLAKIEKEKNWTAVRYRMRETLERPLRACLTDSLIDRKERIALFKQVKELMVKLESESNFKDLVKGTKEVEAKTAVEIMVESYLAKFYDSLQKMPIFAKLNEKILKCYTSETKDARAVLKNELNSCVKLDEIPSKIRMSEQEGLDEMEQEKETEKEHEAQHEKEIESEKESEREVIRQEKITAPIVKEYTTIAPLDGMAYSINHLFEKKFAKINTILPDDVALPGRETIEFSPNFADQSCTLDSKQHASNHLTARYMLALKDGNKTRYILVSHEDARRIKLGLAKNTVTGSREALLCTLDGAIVAQSSLEAKDAFPHVEREELLLQAKFFTAKTNFSSKEVEQLKLLIDNNKKLPADTLRRNCRDYFEECLKYLKTQAEEYHDSYLESMLSK